MSVNKRYVHEQRLVAGRILGRRLRSDEIAYHLNGRRDDNRPANLVVMTRRYFLALCVGKPGVTPGLEDMDRSKIIWLGKTDEGCSGQPEVATGNGGIPGEAGA